MPKTDLKKLRQEIYDMWPYQLKAPPVDDKVWITLDLDFKKLDPPIKRRAQAPLYYNCFLWAFCAAAYDYMDFDEGLPHKLVLDLVKDRSNLEEFAEYSLAHLCGPMPYEDVHCIGIALRDFCFGHGEAIEPLIDQLFDEEAQDQFRNSYLEAVKRMSALVGYSICSLVSPLLTQSKSAGPEEKQALLHRASVGLSFCAAASYREETGKKMPARGRQMAETLSLIPPQEIFMRLLLFMRDKDPVANVRIVESVFWHTVTRTPHWVISDYSSLYDCDFLGMADSDNCISLHETVYPVKTKFKGEAMEENFATHILHLTPAALISLYYRVQVCDDVFFSSEFEEKLKGLGISPAAAHDYAVIGGALAAASMYAPNNVLPEPQETPTQTDAEAKIAQLQKELEQAKNKISSLEAKAANLEREKGQANRELRKLQYESKTKKEAQEGNSDAADLDEENKMLRAALEELTEVLEAEPEEPVLETPIEWPYRTERKVVLFGGHNSFHRGLQELLPDLVIIPPSYGKLDVKPLRTADLACFQCNKTSHSQYWNALAAVKNNNVPQVYLRHANAEICAKLIVQKLQELENVS